MVFLRVGGLYFDYIGLIVGLYKASLFRTTPGFSAAIGLGDTDAAVVGIVGHGRRFTLDRDVVEPLSA